MNPIHHKAYADHTISLINGLGEKSRKLAIENIRSLYRETSAYSIHFSNIRSGLAVFFLSGSFYALYHFLEKSETVGNGQHIEFVVAGHFLIIFGISVHIKLTEYAQSALMHLVQIERIMSLTADESDVTILKNNYDHYEGSELFGLTDIKNAGSLITKVNNGSNLSKAILSSDDLTNKNILSADPNTKLSEEQFNKLVGALNQVVQGGASLYEESRFKDVKLRPETKSLIKENPTGKRLNRLNRLLLEDAFPDEIAHKHKIKKQIVSYFTYWSEPLLEELHPRSNAIKESFTTAYIAIVIAYLALSSYSVGVQITVFSVIGTALFLWATFKFFPKLLNFINSTYIQLISKP